MKELIENLANNNYVIIGLSVLLAVLVILFFILLFSGKKKKPQNNVIEEKKEENIVPDNTNFDRSEYVKETTAEFELTPITDVEPTPDGYMPNINPEESPALNINSKNVEDVPLADFNFDELSKSISAELDKLKEEEEAQKEVSTETTVDAFKETSNELKSVEISKYDVFTPLKEESTPNVASSEPSFITDFSQVAETKVENPVIEEKPEPVIKETNEPLFARFNQEVYDINKKD